MRRSFWRAKIESAFQRRSVVWLRGVRRAGKTTLAKSDPSVRYFDCELPRVRKDVEDPELFFRKLGSGRIVLDEIHRLMNPSEVLKIAADHFPQLQVLGNLEVTVLPYSALGDELDALGTAGS